MTDNLTELFGDVIHTYSRREAIKDGVLVQLSGSGYSGDDWIPTMCAEAGYKIPIAMTATAFQEFVAPIEGSCEAVAHCQDIRGRLWDVLFMTRYAIRAGGRDTTTVLAKLYVVPNIKITDKPHAKKPKLRTIKCVCGPDDDGSPCLTFMLPEED